MSTTARLDLSVWRNDDVFEYPLRVRGVDLTAATLAMQVRIAGDAPGAPLVDLAKVINGNAQGLRVASVQIVDGAPVSDLRIRINKSTVQALPYSGELGQPSVVAYALLIAGKTRLVGEIAILAHAYGSDNAPLNRTAGFGAQRAGAAPAAGATLTIANNEVAELVIDGADLISASSAEAMQAASAAQLAAATALASGRYYPTRAAGEAASSNNQLFSTDDGAGHVIFYRRTAGGSIEVGRAVTPAQLRQIPFQQDAPAILRFVEDRLRDVPTAKDFGAAGDGVTDDTQALRDYAAYVASKNVVGIIPFGRYRASEIAFTGYDGPGTGLVGHGAEIVLDANQRGVVISDSRKVQLGGLLRFSSAAASGLNQRGVHIETSGELEIAARYRGLTYGEYWQSVRTGLATGPYPVPSRTSPMARACTIGVYLAPTAEYVACDRPLITDCTSHGLLVEAGNVTVGGGVVTGNRIGIEVDGSKSTNGDHGAITGTVLNHNAAANLYIHHLDWSYCVTGAQIWAAISEAFGTGNLAYAIGLLALQAKNLNISGTIFGNNQINLAHDGLPSGALSGLSFIADPDRTVANIRAVGPLSISCKLAALTFEGALKNGANNNDPFQPFALTLQNGWVAFGSTYGAPIYRRDGEGRGYVSGLVKSGGLPSVIATLPPGYRPVSDAKFIVVSNDLPAVVTITTNGQITATSGSAAWIALDGIDFIIGN